MPNFSNSCALALLVRATDLCNVFLINCETHDSCDPIPGGVVTQVQASYGAFRELHGGVSVIEERLRSAAHASPQNPRQNVISRGTQASRSTKPFRLRASELLATWPPCEHHIHLVFVRRRQHPRLAVLASFISRVPASLCVRVLVAEIVGLGWVNGSRSALHLDIRDQLLGVTRFAAPPVVATPVGLLLDGAKEPTAHLWQAISAHRTWARGNGGIGEQNVYVLLRQAESAALVGARKQMGRRSSAITVREQVAMGECIATKLSDHHNQLPSATVTMRLGSLRASVLRVDASRVPLASLGWLAKLDGAQPRSEDCDSSKYGAVDHLSRLTQSLRRLLDHTAQLMNARGSAVAAAPALRTTSVRERSSRRSLAAVGATRAGCLDPDYVLYHRELSLERAAAATSLCDRLHSSGFFSVIHGIIKPVMEALAVSQPLASPRLEMYTSPALTLQRSRQQHGLPVEYEKLGWAWWIGQLLAYVMRPSSLLMAKVKYELNASGLMAQLSSGDRLVGLHHVGAKPVLRISITNSVANRAGDVCSSMESRRTRRSCTSLSTYMREVKRLDPSARTIYLSTDSEDVIKQAETYKHYNFIFLKHVQRTSSRRPPELWDKRVWNFYKWGKTEWTQRQAMDAISDMFLLSRAHEFVGKFTSNFFRAAYALHNAECDCIAPYISLDAPWCFDFGLEEGKNWEFPVVNISDSGGLAGSSGGAPPAVWADRGSPLVRLATFQC